MEGAINVAILLEAIAAVWLVWRNFREWQFMRRIRPLMPPDADVPLFDALSSRAVQITLIGAYLLVITALGALGVRLAEIFPPIRAINGALLLVLIAGPYYIGREMRKRATADVGAAHGDVA